MLEEVGRGNVLRWFSERLERDRRRYGSISPVVPVYSIACDWAASIVLRVLPAEGDGSRGLGKQHRRPDSARYNAATQRAGRAEASLTIKVDC